MNRARLCTIERTCETTWGISDDDGLAELIPRECLNHGRPFMNCFRVCGVHAYLPGHRFHALWWSLALVFRSARARSRFRCDMDLSEAFIPIFIGEDCAGKVGEGLCNCAQLWVLISAHTACLSVNQRLRPELT